MSLSHLIQLNNNPELLKDILTSKGLSANEYPVKQWQKLEPTENGFAYCSGLVMSMHLDVYSIFSVNDVYSILFSECTTHQINQLKSLIILVKSILKEKYPSTYKNRSIFMFAKGCVSASTEDITLSYTSKVLYLKSYATVHLGDSLPLSDLSFDTLYSAILTDFNNKVKLMADSDTAIINTAFITALQHETNEEFINRTHNGNVANILNVESFNNYVEQLNLSFLDTPYEPNTKESDNKSIYFENKYSKQTYIIGIQRINTLKMLLMPLLKENNLEKIINLISIAQFYSILFNPVFDNNVIKFAHLNIFELSKEDLLNDPNYFEISVGIFDFKIGKTIKIDQFTDGTPKIFSTVDKAYDYLHECVQKEICSQLDTVPSSVTSKDILVLNMMTC